jgi:hypothetical protein
MATRPIRNRKKVVSSRATEQGIAGHQAAMDAIGEAVSATGNTASLVNGILGEHERAGARASQKMKTHESFAGLQPSHVEKRKSKENKKGIPVGISYEAASALQDPNYEPSSRFK